MPVLSLVCLGAAWTPSADRTGCSNLLRAVKERVVGFSAALDGASAPAATLPGLVISQAMDAQLMLDRYLLPVIRR